ncbi:MAG TPA: hypothetical protein VF457_13045 [Burkholderiaceae bacterium]
MRDLRHQRTQGDCPCGAAKRKHSVGTEFEAAFITNDVFFVGDTFVMMGGDAQREIEDLPGIRMRAAARRGRSSDPRGDARPRRRRSPPISTPLP